MTRHPILHLEIVDAEGRRLSCAHRVFCALRLRSVALRECCACARCDAIVDGEPPAVECALTPEAEGAGEALVLHVLDRGVLAIASGSTALQARRLLVEPGRRELPVVDASSHVVGVVRDVDIESHLVVAPATASPLVIRESLTVRNALRTLAAAHLREATVVDHDGVPIGVFRDLDGLHMLAHRADAAPYRAI